MSDAGVSAAVPPGQGAVGVPPVSGSAKLRAKAEEIKQRGGARPGAGRKPGVAVAAAPAPVAPTPWNVENSLALLRVPFQFAAIGFDNVGFELDKTDETVLGPLAVPVFNQWMPLESKWTALSVFSLAFLSVAGRKLLGFQAYKRAVALQARANQSPAPKPESASTKPVAADIPKEVSNPNKPAGEAPSWMKSDA